MKVTYLNVQKEIPIFFGYKDNEFVSLNSKVNYGETNYWVKFPSIDYFGHLNYNYIDSVLWIGNFDQMWRQEGEKSVFGYPWVTAWDDSWLDDLNYLRDKFKQKYRDESGQDSFESIYTSITNKYNRMLKKRNPNDPVDYLNLNLKRK